MLKDLDLDQGFDFKYNRITTLIIHVLFILGKLMKKIEINRFIYNENTRKSKSHCYQIL